MGIKRITLCQTNRTREPSVHEKRDRGEKLMRLGVQKLADALVKLAEDREEVDDVVERLISSPREMAERFKGKLSALNEWEGFVPWDETDLYAQKLESLLDDLRTCVRDPATGIDLVAAFFEADQAVLAQCDDSSGSVGEVFRSTARDLFVQYAIRYEDKEGLARLVLELCRDDEYGVRDVLLYGAVEYLPEENIRAMIESLQAEAARETEAGYKRQWLFMVQSLARQIKDAKLFERTCIASWDELHPAVCTDIASVYLEAGDPRTALSWLERPMRGSFVGYARDPLLLRIYDVLGRFEERDETALRIFRRCRSADSLTEYLDIVGHTDREAIITEEVSEIHEAEELSPVDAMFLAEIGRVDDAETYLLDRSNQINGDLYLSFVPLAELMRAKGRPLSATMLYRALLDSILKRGYSRAYGHAAHYFQELGKLAARVTDWGDRQSHTEYVESLRERHGRKRSFWRQCGWES